MRRRNELVFVAVVGLNDQPVGPEIRKRFDDLQQ